MRKVERFLQYLDSKGITENRATVECGLSQGLIHQAKSGKSDIGYKSIEKILKTYQDINREWLLYGQGEMLLIGSIEAHASGNSNVVIGSGKISTNDDVKLAVLESENEMLRAQLDDRDRQIEFLKSLINK